ncbi:MAG: hypothetical protein MJE77_39380 [Proteobacteria bacterium]|nr:hypothetical protein [Pseudomonadota bacterium]
MKRSSRSTVAKKLPTSYSDAILPLRERCSDVLTELERQHRALFNSYQTQLVVETPKPFRVMSRITECLAIMALARAICSICTSLLSTMRRGGSARCAHRLYGRWCLLALDTMGRLVDYYCLGICRSGSEDNIS